MSDHQDHEFIPDAQLRSHLATHRTARTESVRIDEVPSPFDPWPHSTPPQDVHEEVADDRDAGFAKTAAIRFLRGLSVAVDMTLVSFDTEVRVSRFGQADFPRLVERLREQATGGMTAFYDALGVYLDGASAQDGRKVLLLYTDGGDTRSRMRRHELLDLIRASDVTVYAIGFQTHLRIADRMMERRRLEEIVGLSGGRCYFPNSVRELDDIYAQIRAELATRYSLGYVSTDPTTDGAWRRVTVKFADSRPELAGVRIRARQGYFAPYFKDAPRD